MNARETRLFRIHELLSTRPVVSSAELRATLGVSEATLKRDIRRLRRDYGAPIVYQHRPEAGYCYDPAAAPFELGWPGIHPDDAARLALLLAMIDSIESEAIRPLLAPLTARLQQTMRRVGLPADDRLQVFASRPLGRRRIEQQIFLTVVEALRREQALDIRYHARYRDQVTRRRIDPARLVFHRDNWYLIAWCRDRRDMRVFACDQIQSAAAAGPVKTRLDAETLASLMATNFGMFIVDDRLPMQTAVLRFTPDRARWVRDEQWHPRQEGRELPDGGWELTVPYRKPDELILEILRHGDGVEVVAPDELRQRIADTLRRAAAIYDDSQ